MQKKNKQFQDYLQESIAGIPDFTVTPKYSEKQNYQNKEKKFNLYDKSSFQSIKNKTFTYKATCKLKFQCYNCISRGQKGTWTTSLGVCDIDYKLDIRKIATINLKEKQQKRQKMLIKCQLMELIYTIEADMQGQITQTFSQIQNKIRRQQIQNLMNNYQIIIYFRYKFYDQQCKDCKRKGKFIFYNEQACRIATNLALNLEKKLLNQKTARKFNSDYQLKQHLSRYCQACKLGQCPYRNNFRQPKQKSKFGDNNDPCPKDHKERVQWFLNKYRSSLVFILKEIKKKSGTIKQAQQSPDKTYPFCLLPKQILKKMGQDVGKILFQLLYLVQKQNK